MKNIAALLFEANILKNIPRAGFHFLGAGKESVAEHSFCITFIAYVMAHLEAEINSLRLITMCLVHDLPESRTGDHNYVQKIQYLLKKLRDDNNPSDRGWSSLSRELGVSNSVDIVALNDCGMTFS